MKILSQLVGCLKPKEKRYLKRLYSTQPNGEDPKKSALFDIIIKGKDLDDHEVCMKLYNAQPNSAFSHTKRRLKEDLLNFLLTQDAAKQFKSKEKQDWLQCNKLILQGEILVSRGILNESEKILKSALRIAEKNEFFSEIIKIRLRLREAFGMKFGMERYNQYNVEIIETIEEYQTNSIVTDFLFNVRLPNAYKTNNTDYYYDFESEIRKIRIRMNDSNKQTTKFNYLLSEITYSEQKYDFEEALSYAKKLELHVTTSEKYQNIRNENAGVSMTIANILINLGSFIESQKYARIAVDTFVQGKGNQLRAMGFLFFTYFRASDFENSFNVIQEAFDHPIINRNKITLGKWKLFNAALYFQRNDFDTSLKILRTNNEVLKDRKGWGIGYRILEMLISLENDDFYIAGYHLDNYVNHLNRLKGAEIDRPKVIGQLIRAIIRFSGDYEKVFEKNKTKIEKLESGLDQYRWNPVGFELIKFDDWLKNKVKL